MKAISNQEIDLELKTYQIDCFISSASFENRSFALVEQLHSTAIDKYIFFATIDFDKKIEENREKMINIVGEEKSNRFDLKISDPVFSFINIVRACSTIFDDSPKTVLLDITTFTHEILLMLFRVIYEHKRADDTILISYTSAKSYSCNVDNLGEKWLTKGVKEVRSIIGYPGYFDPTKKNHLIILVGFEKERTIKLIEEFDFELVSLAFGAKDDSINSDNQILNEKRYKEVLEHFSNARKIELSLVDPIKVKNTILEYVQDFKEYNIAIAPMNNKISTIGVGMAAIENSDIQLFYMQANVYNIDAYSETGDTFYFGQLSF